MEPLEAARATADAVSGTASHFMLDSATYGRGAELGFGGMDFYFVGRGGVLGDVDADVVAAAFCFFEPGLVRTMWEQGKAAMTPAEGALRFAECGHAWAEDNVPDRVHADRLGELAGRVARHARPACAPVFAGFRALPVPEAPKAHALHQMNALRELRFGLHAAAVISRGITPHQAVSVRSPHMAPLFGWNEPTADAEAVKDTWQEAEEATNVAIAHAYEALDTSERAELVELANALHQAISGG
jgi:hypothetical protein